MKWLIRYIEKAHTCRIIERYNTEVGKFEASIRDNKRRMEIEKDSEKVRAHMNTIEVYQRQIGTIQYMIRILHTLE